MINVNYWFGVSGKRVTDEWDAGYIHDKMENLCYTSF